MDYFEGVQRRPFLIDWEDASFAPMKEHCNHGMITTVPILYHI